MIWLTWRQHRAQLLAGAALLVLVIAFLMLTGIGMQASFKDSGAAACLARNAGGCSTLAGSWLSQYAGYQFVIPFFLVLPALVGVFSGGPLVAREVEQGTHRMVWTQSVSRRRSLGLPVSASWWNSPCARTTAPHSPTRTNSAVTRPRVAR